LTIETSLLISGFAVAFAIYTGVSNMKRNEKNDAQKEASALTTVIVKLETIGTGITEIKSEISGVKDDLKDARERIIKVEESTKSAHKRIDTYEAHCKLGEIPADK
jgi:peptidoglycan hydrolase CwlO-like protein